MRHLAKHGITSKASQEKKEAMKNNKTIEETTLEEVAQQENVTPKRFADLQRALVTIEQMQTLCYYESQDYWSS